MALAVFGASVLVLVIGMLRVISAIRRGPAVKARALLEREQYEADARENHRFAQNEGREYGDKGQYSLSNNQVRRVTRAALANDFADFPEPDRSAMRAHHGKK